MKSLKLLLRDYSIEEILERCELEPIEALELLVTYGAISLEDLDAPEGTDTSSEND